MKRLPLNLKILFFVARILGIGWVLKEEKKYRDYFEKQE